MSAFNRLLLRPLAVVLLLALASAALIACETQAETEAREAQELADLGAVGEVFLQAVVAEGPDSAGAESKLSTKAKLYYADSEELGDLIAYLSIGAYTGVDLTGYEIVMPERNKSKGRVLVNLNYSDGATAQTYLGALYVGERGAKEWVIDAIGDGVDLFVPGDVNF